jgi:hypothetical protein
MASLVLGFAGQAIGAGISGSILGLSGAAIGGMIGSTVGGFIDSWIVSSLQPAQRIEGARLDQLQVTAAAEGGVIPRLYGRMRIGGNIIWATDFNETIVKDSQRVGGKGGGGSRVVTTSYVYDASFAVALCEGTVTGIGRVWADGELMDLSDVTWRWYPGDEVQPPDPFIALRMGAATPAYRGLAYVVFEGLELERFGNRIPQLSFEVFRPVDDPDSAEGMARAVTLIPASGEFSLNTQPVRRTSLAESRPENANTITDVADIVVALDRLQAAVPGIQSISLVVAWFGDDLRMSHCKIQPRAEVAAKTTSPLNWSVNGVTRSSAVLVSTDAEGRPIYGGTPADSGVVQAIQEIKARGLRVTFYPFILMDVPPGNSLPNPYSENSAEIGQPAFPWRGRITLSVAPGYMGSSDGTVAAADEVAAFFGTAGPGDFAVSGTTVSWTGGTDWGLRRMILHYAHLCKAAGGVHAFLIGSEMRGMTTARGASGSYPGVAGLKALLEAVRSIMGSGPKLSYAADWSEYFGHHRANGDVIFHLDPLWSHADCDFVGIDNYMPLSDWRDGWDHLDALDWESVHDPAYLASNIAGGEGFDWYYASAEDREDQIRTPITDGAAGKPWVFRYKDLRGWWSEQHFDRPGGVESGTPTGWVPESKPIWFTEIGCPSIDRGPNQPNVFYDPKSSESFVPYFSRGWRDDAVQRSFIEAHLRHWDSTANNPGSSLYPGRMVRRLEIALWTWDARPYPFFPALEGVWSDGENWRRGHWLTGRLGSVQLGGIVRLLCLRAGLPPERIDVSQLWGAAEGFVIAALESPRASIAALGRHFGFDAYESEGRIVFRMRSRRTAATVGLDDLVAPAAEGGDPIEFMRGQETELPQALKWQIARADDEYDPAVVEARRINVHASRESSESFPLAVPPEEAERRVRRALM